MDSGRPSEIGTHDVPWAQVAAGAIASGPLGSSAARARVTHPGQKAEFEPSAPDLRPSPERGPALPGTCGPCPGPAGPSRPNRGRLGVAPGTGIDHPAIRW